MISTVLFDGRIKKEHEHEQQSAYYPTRPSSSSSTVLKGAFQSSIEPSSSPPSILRTTEDGRDDSDNVNDNNDDNVRLIPLVQLTHELPDLLQRQEKYTIGVEGYVTHKRSFGSSLAFMDLVQGENFMTSAAADDVAGSSDSDSDSGSDSDSDSSNGVNNSRPLQVIIKRQTYQHHRTKSSFVSMLKSIYPGMKLYIEGRASPTDNEGQVVFMITYIKILGLSQNPQHLQGILQRVRLDDNNHNDDDDAAHLSNNDCTPSDDNGKGGTHNYTIEQPKTGLSLEEMTFTE